GEEIRAALRRAIPDVVLDRAPVGGEDDEPVLVGVVAAGDGEVAGVELGDAVEVGLDRRIGGLPLPAAGLERDRFEYSRARVDHDRAGVDFVGVGDDFLRAAAEVLLHEADGVAADGGLDVGGLAVGAEAVDADVLLGADFDPRLPRRAAVLADADLRAAFGR